MTFSVLVEERLQLKLCGCVHTASEEEEEEKKKNRGVKTERAEQQQSYAVISTVCTAVCSGLVQLAPSGAALVVLRLRTPSVEPTLEAE